MKRYTVVYFWWIRILQWFLSFQITKVTVSEVILCAFIFSKMCLLSGPNLNTSCLQYSDESTRSKCEIFILSEKLKKRSLAVYPHVFFSFLKLYSKFPFSKFDPHFISSYITRISYSFFLAWITIRPWHIAMRVFQIVFF